MGGTIDLNAGGDIVVARDTRLIGNSGRSTLGDDSDPA